MQAEFISEERDQSDKGTTFLLEVHQREDSD